MRLKQLTFIIILFIIFDIAMIFINLATGAEEMEPSPIFKPEMDDRINDTNNPQSRDRTIAKISERADINLRECPGAACKVIAVLRRGGNIRLTGKRQMVESAYGAAIPWIEVVSESEHCVKIETDKNFQCTDWASGGSYSGWVNELYIQSN